MASTAERIRTLVNENIEVDGKPIDLPDDLNISLTEAGVPSTDVVALTKLIAQEYGVEFSPDQCAELNTLKKVVAYLDSK
jgi:acyl carrier protein